MKGEFYTISKPDWKSEVLNTFPVGPSILCRYMENPTQEHYNGVKRVLRHLKGTEDYSTRRET